MTSDSRPTRRRRARARPILRLTAPTIRVDLGSACAAVWAGMRAAWRRVTGAEPRTHAWTEAPMRALLLVPRPRGGSIVLRMTSHGAVVGHLTAQGKPRCDDWFESQPWADVGVGLGEPDVVVLATGVDANVGGGVDLERLAARGLAKFGGAP